jgi:Uma2 family endonuclease
MVFTPSQLITLEEFLALPETKPASEYVDGKIILKPMPQGQHSRLQQKLVHAINAIAEDTETALALPELRCTFGGRSIVPDVSVFIWTRLPLNADGTIANSFTTHPDWTIEILSPDQSTHKVAKNIIQALNCGTQLGWLIDPSEQIVVAYQPNSTPQYFESATDRLPFPQFLPSLNLTIGQIFGWLKLKVVHDSVDR